MICLVELRGLEPLTLCLQSTFTLSISVAELGHGRSLSPLNGWRPATLWSTVVVRPHLHAGLATT